MHYCKFHDELLIYVFLFIVFYLQFNAYNIRKAMGKCHNEKVQIIILEMHMLNKQ